MASISGFKLNDQEVKELLKSNVLMSQLKSKGDSIAASMSAEGHGEFCAFEGNNATRARVFVDTYDNHAKYAAAKDPSIFTRHLR